MSKRARLAVVIVVLVYGFTYYLARSERFLIHEVSRAGDTYYHSIRTSGYHSWTIEGVGEPISYYLFTPLRWLEAFVWRFIPRDYGIH